MEPAYNPETVENFLAYRDFIEVDQNYEKAHDYLNEENLDLNVVNLNSALDQIGEPGGDHRDPKVKEYIDLWSKITSVDELVIEPEETNYFNDWLVDYVESFGTEVVTREDDYATVNLPRFTREEVEIKLFEEVKNKVEDKFQEELKQIQEKNEGMSYDDASAIAYDRKHIRTEFLLANIGIMMKSSSIKELQKLLQTVPINVNKYNKETMVKAKEDAEDIKLLVPEEGSVMEPVPLPSPMDPDKLAPYLESFFAAVEMKQRYKQYAGQNANWLNPQQPILATAYGPYPSRSQWMEDYKKMKSAYDKRVADEAKKSTIEMGQAQMIVREDIISEMPRYYVGVPGVPDLQVGSKYALPQLMQYFGVLDREGESALEASMRIRGGFDAMSEDFETVNQIIMKVPGEAGQNRARRSLPNVREEAMSYGSQKVIVEDNLKQVLLYLDEKDAKIDDFENLLREAHRMLVVEVEGEERSGSDSDMAFKVAAEALDATDNDSLVKAARYLTDLDTEYMMRIALLNASVDTPTLWSDGAPTIEIDLEKAWMQTSLTKNIENQIQGRSVDEEWLSGYTSPPFVELVIKINEAYFGEQVYLPVTKNLGMPPEGEKYEWMPEDREDNITQLMIELDRKVAVSADDIKDASIQYMRNEIGKQYSYADLVTSVFTDPVPDRINNPTLIASEYVLGTLKADLMRITQLLTTARENGQIQIIGELEKQRDVAEAKVGTGQLNFDAIRDDSNSLPNQVFDFFNVKGILSGQAASTDLGDSYKKALRIHKNEVNGILSLVKQYQHEPDPDRRYDIIIQTGLHQVELKLNADKQSVENFYSERIDLEKEYVRTDDLIQELARSSLKKKVDDGLVTFPQNIPLIDTDLQIPALAIPLSSTILENYLNSDLSMEEIRKELALGDKMTRNVELIGKSESAADAALAQAISEINSKEDLSQHFKDMKKKELPKEFQEFFPGDPENNLWDIVNSNEFTDVKYQELRNFTHLVSGALDVQRFQANVMNVVQYMTFDTVMDTNSYTVTKKPSALTQWVTVLPSTATEFITESNLPAPVLFLINPYLWAATRQQTIPFTDIKLFGASMSTWYGGGDGDFNEYWDARRIQLRETQAPGQAHYTLAWMYENHHLRDGLHEYMISKRPDDGYMSYSDIEGHTRDFLYSVAEKSIRDPMHQTIDGRPILTKEMIDWYYTNGHLGDVETVYGKALGTILSGAMDATPLMIGTPAQLDYYLQERLPDIYVGTRNQDVNYIDRVVDNMTHMPPGFYDSYSWIGAGLGFRWGSVQQSFTNTGQYAELTVPVEEWFFQGAAFAPKKLYRVRQVWKDNADIISKQPKLPLVDILDEGLRTQYTLLALTENTALIGPMIREDMIKKAVQSPEGSAKYIRDPELMQEAMDATYKTDPLASTVGAALGGTLFAGAVGAFVGGAEGAILASVFQNPAGRRLFSNAALTVAGLAPKGLKETGAIPYYQRKNATFEHTQGVMASAYARRDAFTGTANPATDIYGTRKAGTFYESEMYDETLNTLGISKGDAIQHFADLTLRNRGDLADVAAAIMKNRVELDKFSNAIRYGTKLENNLQYLTGREEVVIRSKGYKDVKKNFDSLVKRKKISRTEADVQLAKLRVMAIVSEDPGAFFKDVSAKYEIDESVISIVKGEMADEGVADLSPTEMYNRLLDTPYQEQAYFKSIGLYEYIYRHIELGKDITIMDVENYKLQFERHGYIDKVDSDLIKLESAAFQEPSARMEGYDIADISIEGVNVQVYYKSSETKLTIGEIHHDKPDLGTREDLHVRTEATKVLISRKLIEGVHRFEWDLDSIFHQVIENDYTKDYVDWAKTEYSNTVNRYLDTFQKSLKDVTKISEPGRKSREVSRAISKSAADYFGKEWERKTPAAYFVTDTSELLAHSTSRMNVNSEDIIESINDSLKTVKEYDAYIEKMTTYNTGTLRSEIAIFRDEAYEVDGVTKKRTVEDKIKSFITHDRKFIYGSKEKQNALVEGYTDRLKDAADRDAEIAAIKVDMKAQVDPLISSANIGYAKKRSNAIWRIRKNLRDLQVQDPVRATQIAEYLKDTTADKPDIGFDLDEALENIPDVDFEPIEPELYSPDMGIKMYRGKSPSDRIVENGSKTLEFRSATISNKKALILESIMDRADADRRSILDISYELEQARSSRNTDRIEILEAELEGARADVFWGSEDVRDYTIDDMYGEERMTLRLVLTTDEMVPDIIGYHAHNLEYGSAIRSELEMAGISFREKMAEGKDGTPYRYIYLTKKAKARLKTDALPVLDYERRSASMILLHASEIERQMDLVSGDLPPVSSLDDFMIEESIVLSDGSRMNKRVLDNTRRWMGIKDENDPAKVKESIERFRSKTETLIDDIYGGYSVQDLTQMVDEGLIPEERIKTLSHVNEDGVKVGYLEDRTVDGRDMRTYRFVEGDKEYPYSVEVINTADIRRPHVDVGSLVISNSAKLLREHVSSILYQAAQEGFETVIFVDPNKSKKKSIELITKDWESSVKEIERERDTEPYSELLTPNTIGEVADVVFEITPEMIASVPEKKSRLTRSVEDADEPLFDFKITENTDLHSFMEMNANALIDLMDDENFNALARYFDSYERTDGRRVLTRQGRKDLAMVYSYSKRSQGIPDLEIKALMKEVEKAFTNMTYYVLKERVEDPIKGSSKVPLSEATLHQNFKALERLDEMSFGLLHDTLIMNSIEIGRMIEGPIMRGVEGLQKIATEKGIPLRQRIRKTQDVQVPLNELARRNENKEAKAAGLLRQQAMKTKLPFDQYIFEIRPSSDPYSINNPTALIPEKTRASRDKAKRILAEGGEEINEAIIQTVRDDDIYGKYSVQELTQMVDENLIPADRVNDIRSYLEEEARIQAVQKRADFRITHGEIDRAFLDLVEEGKGVDIQDLLFRNIGVVRTMTVMQTVKADYTALTVRTIVRAEDAEMYSEIAHAKVRRLFGVDDMREVADMFDNNTDIDAMSTHTSTDLAGRNQLKATFIKPDVIARLQMLVTDVRGTPGGNNLPYDLTQRIKNPVDGSVDIYLGEMPMIRDAIIDNSVTRAGRRNHTVETANRHAVYGLMVAMPAGGLEGFGKFANVDWITKIGREWRAAGNRVVDGVFELYNPSLMEHPFSKKPPVEAPAIIQLMDEFQRSFRAFGSRDIEKLIGLLTEKASKEDIAKAVDILDDARGYVHPMLDNLKPGFLFITQALRRFLHEPVSPVHVQYLRNLNQRIHSIRKFTTSTGTDLNSLSTVSEIKHLVEQVAPLELDNKQRIAVNLLGKHLVAPMKSQKEIDAVRKAYKTVKDIYNDEFASEKIFSLDDLKKEIENIQNMFETRVLTHRERDAIEQLKIIFDSGIDLKNLTEEQRLDMSRHVSIIYHGINSRHQEVQQKGLRIFRSVQGNKDWNIAMGHDNAEAAYTLFYTGRIAMGDQDFAKIKNKGVFDIENPPDLDSWKVRDLERIARQYGIEPKDSQLIKNGIESRFGVKLDKITKEEIVEVANRIATEPNRGMFNNLLQLARDKGEGRLRQKGQSDTGLIVFEMVIRLMAEEKVSNLAKNIAQTHIYGDLMEVTRNKLIEMGFDPILKQEEMIQKIENKLNNWLLNADLDISYKDEKGRSLKAYKTTDNLDNAAYEIAEEIIVAYQLVPGGIKDVQSEGIQRYVAPDGETYLLPQQMINQFETGIDNVAASGKAKLKRHMSLAELSERNQTLDRLHMSLGIAEEAKQYLAEQVLMKRVYEHDESGVTTGFTEALSKADAYAIVEQYLLETHPDYKQTKRRIKELKGAEKKEFSEVEVSAAGGKVVGTTRLTDEIPNELEAAFEVFVKERLEEQIKKDTGLLKEIMHIAKPLLRTAIVDLSPMTAFKDILKEAVQYVLQMKDPADLYKRMTGKGPVRITPEIKAILDEDGLVEALHSSKGIEEYLKLEAEKLEKETNKKMTELEEGSLLDRFVRLNYEKLKRTTAWQKLTPDKQAKITEKLVDTSSIPSRAAEYISAIYGAVFSGHDRRVFLGRPYNMLKKQAVTTGFIFPNPGYYINNILGAVAQAYLQGGISGISDLGAAIGRNPDVYQQALRYLHKGNQFGLEASQKSRGIMVTRDGRLFTAETLADSADRYGIGATFIKAELARAIGDDIRRTDPERWMSTGLANLGTGRALNDMYLEWAQTTDNMFRLAMYMDQLHKGLSEAEAASIVRRTFYDYADLSEKEKQFLREVFLFYAYMRKNQVQVFRALADNPSRVMGTIRMIKNSQKEAMGDEDPRYLTEWMQLRYMLSGEEINFTGVKDEHLMKDIYGRKIYLFPQFGVAEGAELLAPMMIFISRDVAWQEASRALENT